MGKKAGKKSGGSADAPGGGISGAPGPEDADELASRATPSSSSSTDGVSKGAKVRKSTKGNAADGSHPCSNCGADGATRCCSRCNNAWYCSKTITNAAGKEINPCQKVRACRDDKKEIRALIVSCISLPTQADWKYHKRSCAATVVGMAISAQLRRESSAAADAGDQCVICIGPLRSATTLPCGHPYCSSCIKEWEDVALNKTWYVRITTTVKVEVAERGTN